MIAKSTIFQFNDFSGVPTLVHPLVREHFTDSDDVGDAPKNIKANWTHISNLDWSLFPNEPEVRIYIPSIPTPISTLPTLLFFALLMQY